MNTAIPPWYVLHQTLTIIAAWYLAALALPVGIEASPMFCATILGCALGYEVIRRFRVSRFLFGLKLDDRPGGTSRAAGLQS